MKKNLSLIIGTLMLISVDGIGTAFTSDIPTFDDNSVDNIQGDKKVVDKSVPLVTKFLTLLDVLYSHCLHHQHQLLTQMHQQ